MRTTTNEGLPYALATDAMLEPAQLQGFLGAQDGKFPGWAASFVQISKAPAFAARTTVDGGTISQNNVGIVQFDTTDYDQGMNGNKSGWSSPAAWGQQPNDGPSFWVFGCTVFILNASGTVNANNLVQVNMQVTDVDPNSTTGATITYNQLGKAECIDDASGGAQAIQVITLARFRNASGGSMQVFWTYHDATNTGPITKRYKAGSRIWGFRVGSAA